MNEHEKQLIEDLSTQLSQRQQPLPKDADADRLIKEKVTQQHDVVYSLVQAVLLQQAAIRELQNSIKTLEKKEGVFSRIFGGRRASTQSGIRSAPVYPTPNALAGGGQGSFLGSALTTAAGVAGGMFLFEGLSHLFDGNVPHGMGGDGILSNVNSADLFQGQSAMLDQGFGTNDSFVDAPSSLDSGGDWGDSDGFGGGDDFF